MNTVIFFIQVVGVVLIGAGITGVLAMILGAL